MKRIHPYLCLSVLLFAMVCASVSAEPDAPLNAVWQAGTLATAVWDRVDGADYYEVLLHVWRDDECIGQTETGTCHTRIDVRQEINYLLKYSETDVYGVSFSVRAVRHDESCVSAGAYSAESAVLPYINRGFKKAALPAPSNPLFTEKGIAAWDQVDHAECYNIQIWLDCDGTTYTFISGRYRAESGYRETVTVDISDWIADAYAKKGLTGPITGVRFSVYALILTPNPLYSSGKYSELSDPCDWDDPVPVPPPAA